MFDGDIAKDFAISDGSESIWISMHRTSSAESRKLENFDARELVRGARLEVDGVIDPGAYAPSILPFAIRPIGVEPLPIPKRVPISRLLSGAEDGQWIEVEGVVQEAYEHTQSPIGTGFCIMVDGHRCRVVSTMRKGLNPNALVDAEIRVRGIFAPDANFRAEAALPKLIISHPAEDIEVIEHPNPDPFKAQRVPLNRLMPFSPDAHPFHRKVIEGVITFAVPGRFMFVEDGRTGVRVDSESTTATEGQRVEVAGFVDTVYTFASLKSAIVRVLGQAPVPPPEPVALARLLDPSMRTDWGKANSHDYGGRAVTLRGMLRRVVWQDERVPETVWIESEGRAFAAHFPKVHTLSHQQLSEWLPGTSVEVTGVCEYEFALRGDAPANYEPSSFHLWLAAPERLRVLHPAPWWTTQRLVMALGGLGAALLIAVAWTLMLRRQVAFQTRIIEEKGHAVATSAERARIARDLHDDLGANLTQIALLSELACRDLNDPENARAHLNNVFAAAHDLSRQLDGTVWAINPANDSFDSLVQYICKFGHEFLSLAGIRCRLDVAMDLPDFNLGSAKRHNLLLAVKEALHNVVRHAGATLVTIRIAVQGNTAVFEIEDNGRGIPHGRTPPGHDGLGNMPARLKQFGGACSICTGSAGGGTLIRLVVPVTVSL